METLVLDVKSRSQLSPTDIRREDMIPAVFYGPKQTNLNLSIDYQTFRRVFEKGGQNTVIQLNIDNKDKTYVLVQDLQFDPVSDRFIHVDFKFVDLNKEIETEVPLEFIGESKAVREMQGTLMQNRDFISVKCMAGNIPHSIQVDISTLVDFNMAIRVKDIVLPEGVVSEDDPEITVATVAPPKAEEEEAPAEVVPAEGEAAAPVPGAEGEAKDEKGKAKAKAEKDKES